MLFDNIQFYSLVLDMLEHGIEHVVLEISFLGCDCIIELSVIISCIYNMYGEMIGVLVIFFDLIVCKEIQCCMV